MEKAKIIIYTQPRCTKCEQLKKLLKDKGFQYEERTDINEMIELGLKRTPALSVNGELFDDTKAVAWVKRSEENTNEEQ